MNTKEPQQPLEEETWMETTEPSYCPECKTHNGNVSFLRLPGQSWSRVTDYCNSCNDKRYAAFLHEKSKKDPQSAFNKWLNQCPPRCRELDQEWLLSYQPVIQQVLDWQWLSSGTGLFLYGETGTGKTNAIFLLLTRLVQTRGTKPVYITATRLGKEFIDACRSLEKSDKLQNYYAKAPILFIDDLGQETISPRVREGLFDLLDTRANYRRPTFITSNYNPAAMVARFDEAKRDQHGNSGFDGDDAMLRRILQPNTPILFPNQLPAQYTPLGNQQTLQLEPTGTDSELF